VARAVSRCRNTGKTTEHFALIREPHCAGFSQSHNQTVAEWIQSQGLSAYLAMNDRFLEIIALKHRAGPGPLDLRSNRIFELALYDLDRFREHVLNDGWADDTATGTVQRDTLAEDEVALLAYAHEWVKQVVFGKPTPVHK
jgi:hypothetical protein